MSFLVLEFEQRATGECPLNLVIYHLLLGTSAFIAYRVGILFCFSSSVTLMAALRKTHRPWNVPLTNKREDSEESANDSSVGDCQKALGIRIL